VCIICNIWSTRWVPNGYGCPLGMGTGEVSYPWARVRVEFCTHQLYEYGYGITLPCPYPTHCHPCSLAWPMVHVSQGKACNRCQSKAEPPFWSKINYIYICFGNFSEEAALPGKHENKEKTCCWRRLKGEGWKGISLLRMFYVFVVNTCTLNRVLKCSRFIWLKHEKIGDPSKSENSKRKT
jgi:hypothetical protein